MFETAGHRLSFAFHYFLFVFVFFLVVNDFESEGWHNLVVGPVIDIRHWCNFKHRVISLMNEITEVRFTSKQNGSDYVRCE